MRLSALLRINRGPAALPWGLFTRMATAKGSPWAFDGPWIEVAPNCHSWVGCLPVWSRRQANGWLIIVDAYDLRLLCEHPFHLDAPPSACIMHTVLRDTERQCKHKWTSDVVTNPHAGIRLDIPVPT